MVRSVPEVARPLLEPHLAAMEARLRPGATVLTWASMNIDGYLHFAHAVRIYRNIRLPAPAAGGTFQGSQPDMHKAEVTCAAFAGQETCMSLLGSTQTGSCNETIMPTYKSYLWCQLQLFLSARYELVAAVRICGLWVEVLIQDLISTSGPIFSTGQKVLIKS